MTNFQYKFTVTFKDLCKNSKRCLNLLNPETDQNYIDLLKVQADETELDPMTSSNSRQVSFAVADCLLDKSISQETAGLAKCLTPSTKSILASNKNKRKPSTPHPSSGVKFFDEELTDEARNSKNRSDDEEGDLVSPSKKREVSPKLAQLSKSEKSGRVLTSSFRISKASIPASAGKFVKFSAVKYMRNICFDDVKVDSEENLELDETGEKGF